ncbi:MAG TPA: arginine deiminase family protein [Thermoanaerobaculia bacterium]|nr:arginine deiminase family protein [Thermoanaerobaculia bacterium]
MTTGAPTLALTRAISPRLAACELTHLVRAPIDLGRARAQHRRYEALLRELGCRVERIEPAPEHPDSVFIEDTAVVLDEVAVIARPGAASRRGEVAAVEARLAELTPIRRIEAPATLDGGDVLVAGRRVFVGRTARTDDAGIAQLAAILEPFGYQTRGVEVRGCLHLKTAATAIADDAVVVQPEWIGPATLDGLEIVEVDPAEPFAANVARIGEALMMPEAFPRTRARLEARGHRVHAVAADELAKAEGGVTCCAILVRA